MSTVADGSLALQRLVRCEREFAEAIAFVQPLGGGRVREWGWREAVDEARRMAAHLRARGIGPGDQVALLSKNSAWWLMADWAIWLSGAVSVPLYPTLTAETLGQILSHSEARLLFVGKLDGWERMRPGVPAGLPCVATPLAPAGAGDDWDAIVRDTAPLTGEPLRAADDLATIMYTSGTTGRPKGVMLSFGAFAAATASGLRRVTVIDRHSRVLSYLPLAHVAERTLVEQGQLATGMKVFFAESIDTFAEDLRRARPTVFFSVPRLWLKFQQGVHARMAPARLQRLLGLPVVGALVRRKVLKALGLDRCRFAAGGAAPMPPQLLDWYRQLGLDIVEVYGMTENCGISHSTLAGRPRPGSVGLPYDGLQCRIAPANGEIEVSAAWLMSGYFKEPELTRQAFGDDGWLRTGDRGELDAEGHLRITGRVKDLFKTSKGKYVAPAPIEDRLVMHEAIEACVVAGANLGQPLALAMLAAAAVARGGEPGERERLQVSMAEHLRQVNARLDPHERLACVVLMTGAWTVDNGLVTPTFKVRRNRVDDVYAACYERWEASGAPVLWGDAPPAPREAA